jgi:hypothetical protein
MKQEYSFLKDFYPTIIYNCDNVAIKSKKKYLFLIGLDIYLMVLAVLVSLFYNFNTFLIGFIIFILVLSSFIISFIILKQSYDKLWFAGRAICESVKSLTWLFVIGTPPFNIEKEISHVDHLYIDRIKELLKQYPNIYSFLGSENYITAYMKEIRNYNFEDKKAIYIKYRIKEQQDWYTSRCEYNRNKSILFNYFIIFAQVIAIIFIVIAITNPNVTIHIFGLFTSVAIGVLSWQQLKEFRQLANSYGLASQELIMILEESDHIKNLLDLAYFVDDSENAISREHVMWLARKDML